jgi:hypothetical protein
MTKTILAATLAVALSGPAFAQAIVEVPAATGTVVVAPPVAPGVVTRQGGATGEPYAGTYSPTGRAADGASNDSAAGGNAGQPSRVGTTSGFGGGK